MAPPGRVEVPDPAVVVLSGPAGSGKSTFAVRHFAPQDVLSTDDFRGLVAGDPADQSATSAAFGLLRHALDERMKRRRLTVVDATSISRRERRRFLGVARKHDVPAIAIVFALPLDVCQQRAGQRPERPIEPDLVARQHASFLRHLSGIHDEGFAEVALLNDETELEDVEVVRVPASAGTAPPATAGGGLPPAVIVDLDGTLTSAAWREHHLRDGRRDWAAFFAGMGRDAPVRPLIELVDWVAARASVILLTGRPDEHETVVRRWLADHAVPYDRLLLRASGDRREDTVIKRERYLQDVAPYHDVRLVIDDRPRVIEMWRAEGLYVLTAVDPRLDPLPEPGFDRGDARRRGGEPRRSF